MSPKYFYNTNTHRLHIKGFCKESKLLPYNVVFFNSQDEAYAYDGLAVGVCKNCQKKLEKMLEENKKMKRCISLVLALIMVFLLCACSSKEAKAVDKMILSIGEATIENADAVYSAVEAYNALSDKDKDSLENYSILEDAKETLYKAELYELANRILDVYYHCSHVVDGTRIIWKNVGSSDFWGSYNAVRSLVLDKTKAEYDELMGKNCFALIWGAARGLCPSNVYDTNRMTSEGQEATIDLCLDFNNSYDFISNNMDAISEDVRKFKDRYGEEHSDEVSTLNDWCIECSMYVDFALEPAGNYNSYVSTADEFEQNMNRYTKVIDAYY